MAAENTDMKLSVASRVGWRHLPGFPVLIRMVSLRKSMVSPGSIPGVCLCFQ